MCLRIYCGICFLHLVQIQQHKANKTVLLSRPSVSIRMNLDLLGDV